MIHGAEIIKHALLPIRQLSEEAQETKHKDFKKFRNNNTRKCSGQAINEDTFNRLLSTSVPHIYSIRIKSYHKKVKILDPQAADLILK